MSQPFWRRQDDTAVRLYAAAAIQIKTSLSAAGNTGAEQLKN